MASWFHHLALSNKARRWARKWEEKVWSAGPARAAALTEIHEAGAEAGRRIEAAERDGSKTASEAATAKGRRQVIMARAIATVRLSIGAVSEARGLQEWHAAAVCLEWRWRAACAGEGVTYGGKETGEMYGGILQEPTTAWTIIMRAAEVERDDERRWVPITTGTTELSGQGMADYGTRERGRRTVDGGTSGLDRRASNARSWWRRGGKSKRIEALRGEEVHAGRRSDRWGKWAVKAVVDVRRPRLRRGRQLEARVQWEGADPATGETWAHEWLDIKRLSEDLKIKARTMEKRKYAVPYARPAARAVPVRRHEARSTRGEVRYKE